MTEENDVQKPMNSIPENDDLSPPLLFPGLFPNTGDIPVLNRKVFQGYRVSITEHPYIVSIRRNFAHILVGTLITQNLVITVAHPLHNVPLFELSVVVGETYADRGSILLTVIALIVHDEFDMSTLVNDIALLQLYESTGHSFKVKPVTGLWNLSYPFSDRKAFVTGWGRCDLTGHELCFPRSSAYYPDEYLDPMLKSIQFTMKDDNSTGCDAYLTRMDVPLSKHRVSMLCAGTARALSGTAPCMAVPGAPLVVAGRVVALASWGYGCGYSDDLPLVYTDLRYHEHWVNQNLIVSNRTVRANVSAIFEVTKAFKMLAWMQFSRGVGGVEMQWQDIPEVEIQPLEDDKAVLSRFTGYIYDIRDYVAGGRYAVEKQRMLKMMKIVMGRTIAAEEPTAATAPPATSPTQPKHLLLSAYVIGGTEPTQPPRQLYGEFTTGNEYHEYEYN